MTLTDTRSCGIINLYFGSYPIKSPRGPLCNRRDALDEESLCELARLHERVWKRKFHLSGSVYQETHE
jgi:hypothetical protein